MWKDAELEEPKPGVYWAWCVFYDEMHLAGWDGKDRTDNGHPRLSSKTSPGDDYYLRFYNPVKMPAPPKLTKEGDLKCKTQS
jgi:hypothetical protein